MQAIGLMKALASYKLQMWVFNKHSHWILTSKQISLLVLWLVITIIITYQLPWIPHKCLRYKCCSFIHDEVAWLKLCLDDFEIRSKWQEKHPWAKVHAWLSRGTYINIQQGIFYLAVIIDVYIEFFFCFFHVATAL